MLNHLRYTAVPRAGPHPGDRVEIPDRARVANVMKKIVDLGLATWSGVGWAPAASPNQTTRFFATRSRRSWNGGAFTATAKRRHKGKPVAEHGRGRAQEGRQRAGGRAGKARRKPAAGHDHGRPARDAPEGQAALEAGSRRHPELDRARCRLAGRAGAQGSPIRGSSVVGVRAARSPAGSQR